MKIQNTDSETETERGRERERVPLRCLYRESNPLAGRNQSEDCGFYHSKRKAECNIYL